MKLWTTIEDDKSESEIDPSQLRFDQSNYNSGELNAGRHRSITSMNRIMMLCQNNPFGRHVFIINDIENEDDNERFMSQMRAMSQELTKGSENSPSKKSSAKINQYNFDDQITFEAMKAKA